MTVTEEEDEPSLVFGFACDVGAKFSGGVRGLFCQKRKHHDPPGYFYPF